ncbi:MAG: GerMN domain-containing protein [Clostridiales bacterium]|jgi:germination protein M|nr:GerMN domain-containing protein [Clostridiales bacterium]
MGRRVLIIVAGLLAAAVLLGYGLSVWGRGDMLTIHYYDTVNNTWDTELYETRETGLTAADTAGRAIGRLERIQEQNAAWRTLPRGYIAELSLDGSVYTVRFTPEFSGLTLLEMNIAASSVVYTLTEIPGIESVLFYSGDTEFTLAGTLPGPLDRSRLFLSAELLPDNVGTQLITLYFLNKADNALTAVQRRVAFNPSRSIENIIIDELIAGPDDEGQQSLIPSDAKLRENVRVDSGICYVDFTADFLTRYANEESLTLAVYSIVNTLLDNTGATQVQLLFAGDRTAAQHSVIDLGGTISRN